MSLDRESLLRLTAGRKTEPVDTPAGVVFARGLTAADWDEYENASAHQDGDRISYRANRVVLFRLAACNESGHPLFTAADDPKLRDLPRDVVEPVCLAAQRLSGATRKAESDAGKSSPAPSESGSS